MKYLYIFPKQVKFHLAADFIGYEVKPPPQKNMDELNGKYSNYIYQNVFIFSSRVVLTISTVIDMTNEIRYELFLII